MSAEMPTDLLFYVKDDEGETWAYQLVTKPIAALYWKPSSYPLKLTDIRIAHQTQSLTPLLLQRGVGWKPLHEL